MKRRSFRDRDAADILATERIGKLHDALKQAGYTDHDLQQFLVRIVFCLFADDTGIFEPRNIFLELLENRTRQDGSDLDGWLSELFEVLNTPEERRQNNLDSGLARFPCVNGALFSGPLGITSFNADIRQKLIEACRLDWSEISPAIFGSLLQSVMDKAERRAQGAHYTTEKNILKVIKPLFLDDLRAEFDRLKARKTRRRTGLLAFHKRLATLTFFDPACGSGNFLIIAYRELRILEIEVLKQVFADGRLVPVFSVVDVDQFYGIEIDDFPARIAETALWMIDRIMNNRLCLKFGQKFVRIPLRKSPRIVRGDALDIDWSTVLAPEKCRFILGNPPFVGAK